MVIIDDCSDDGTYERIIEAVNDDKRITVVKNEERKYALRNIVESIWRYSGHDDCICLLDGDDSFIDSQVLNDIEKEYHKTGADALWTQHINSDGTDGNSGLLEGNALTCSWRMSHLRTFKKPLIHGIKLDTFKDETGEWWKCAYDQAIYRPIVYLAKKPVFYDRVCVKYNLGQGDNVQAIQIITARKIQNKLREDFKNNEPKNVLLVVNGKSEGCDTRFHQGEKRFPLGVLTLSAALKARNHNVRLIDRFASPGKWNNDDVEWSTHIGFHCTTPNFPDARKMIDECKGRGKVLMAGGPHAILHPEDLQDVDFICKGEADFEIIDIVEDGKASETQTRIDNLDSTPFPDYELGLDNYFDYTWDWFYDKSERVFPMNTSRSCPHSCSFCDVKAIWGKRWTAKSAERVVEDVRYLYQHCGAKAIYFREDNFCCSRDRLEDICYGLIDLPIKWACEMRADSAQDFELLQLMQESGCVGIYVGAESGSNKMLEVYNKGITRDQIIKACDNATKSGINVLMSIIEKHPLETETDIALTEEMINICKPERVCRCDYRKV